MKSLCTTLLTGIFLIAPVTLSADGLIYQLPEDGTSLSFDLHTSFERGGQGQQFPGSFLISSVGKETVDDAPCRWIEFKMTVKVYDHVQTWYAKALIPESELKKGHSPIDHVRKAWYKWDDQDPQDITDFSSEVAKNLAGPLPAFLCGPLKDSQRQDAVTVKSGLGEHQCQVETGSTSFELAGETQKCTFTNYAHKDAPFGLVKSDIKIEMERNGQATGSGTLTLVAKEAGKDAKPAISNGK